MGRADGGSRKLRGLLAKNPEWESDLLGLYGVDIWDAIDGKVPTRKVFALLERLPFEKMSLWRAQQLGSPEHVGWDAEMYLAAEQNDLLNNLLAITASKGSKRRPKLPEPGYRPPTAEKTEHEIEVPSLDHFDVNALVAAMGAG